MGNPFVHLDLTCDNPAEAKKFYGSVFDWQFTDFPDMKWVGIGVGEGVGGGMGGKQSPDQPTAWTAYVGVADVKKTMAKAKKAGATIVVPFVEVGGMGYLGVFVDPQGATIGVWQAAAKAATPPAAPKKAAAPKKVAKAPAAAPKAAPKQAAKAPAAPKKVAKAPAAAPKAAPKKVAKAVAAPKKVAKAAAAPKKAAKK